MTMQVNQVLADLNKSMLLLRDSMKGLPVRAAGFKAEHDALARAVSTLSVDVSDATVLIDQ